MFKRTFAVILALALAVGCLAGCGDKKDGGSNKGGATAASDLPKLEITSEKVKYLCWICLQAMTINCLI